MSGRARVYAPEEAAALLAGISVPQLIRLVKEGDYEYTRLMPGARLSDWGRGRKTWGLSDSQLDAIVRGQSARMAASMPEPAPAEPTKPPAGLPSHDGKSRVRKLRTRP